ncbi:MAG: hypothetical protein CL687_02815 [Candidatus Pelagibacter sp.]|nr:hypothetical protein [Candidatus Pelagibacter sp.]|tara:strand:- start:303 stop:527 length:225 start_codon:yes stop_codon:yes gene_type:complete
MFEIRFAKSKSKKASKAKVKHNSERLDWIEEAGKSGRSLNEIINHRQHYKEVSADLNYDLHEKRIFLIINLVKE